MSENESIMEAIQVFAENSCVHIFGDFGMITAMFSCVSIVNNIVGCTYYDGQIGGLVILVFSS